MMVIAHFWHFVERTSKYRLQTRYSCCDKKIIAVPLAGVEFSMEELKKCRG